MKDKKDIKKIIKDLQNAFNFEEKPLIEFQYDCYKNLPGYLNEKELKRAKEILNILLVESLSHANIDNDLITKFYGKITKKL